MKELLSDFCNEINTVAKSVVARGWTQPVGTYSPVSEAGRRSLDSHLVHNCERLFLNSAKCSKTLKFSLAVVLEGH